MSAIPAIPHNHHGIEDHLCRSALPNHDWLADGPHNLGSSTLPWGRKGASRLTGAWPIRREKGSNPEQDSACGQVARACDAASVQRNLRAVFLEARGDREIGFEIND